MDAPNRNKFRHPFRPDQVPGTWKLKKYWLSGRIGWKGVMAVGESTERLENLIRLLRTLSREEVAAVWHFVEELVQRRVVLKDIRAPYVTPTETAEETIYRTPPQGSREALLECLGTWEFEPGELDEILADIERARMMELEEEHD
jgi:hypothetical protein